MTPRELASEGKLIKGNVAGVGSTKGLTRSISSAKISILADDTYAVMGALIVAFDDSSRGEEQFIDALAKGQLLSQSLLQMEREVELILNEYKYKLICTRTAPDWFSISVAGNPDSSVNAHVRRLSDGGYLTGIGGKSCVAYLTSSGDAAAIQN